MTKLLLLTTTLAFATPALATTETRYVLGCEVIQAENGNYFYKADATCDFDRTGLSTRGDGNIEPEEDEDEEDPTDPTDPTDPGDGDDDGAGDDDDSVDNGGNPCGGNCGNGNGNGGGNGTGDEGNHHGHA